MYVKWNQKNAIHFKFKNSGRYLIRPEIILAIHKEIKIDDSISTIMKIDDKIGIGNHEVSLQRLF
jgi:hypothetical protein